MKYLSIIYSPCEKLRSNHDSHIFSKTPKNPWLDVDHRVYWLFSTHWPDPYSVQPRDALLEIHNEDVVQRDLMVNGKLP